MTWRSAFSCNHKGLSVGSASGQNDIQVMLPLRNWKAVGCQSRLALDQSFDGAYQLGGEALAPPARAPGGSKG